MIFDFHTHNPQIGKSGIYSFRIGIDHKLPDSLEYFTAGIHPWDVEEIDKNKALKELDFLLKHKKCVGIGEIGLDKYCGTNLDLQLEIFRKQLELGKNSSQKVLIIHCAKAYQEIIQEKISSSDNYKWVLHGFNGSEELIQSLKAHGFYFSIGGLLLNKKSKISKYFKQIPIDRLFLETDENNFSIEKIYLEGAKKRHIDVNQLQNSIQNNLIKLLPSLNG